MLKFSNFHRERLIVSLNSESECDLRCLCVSSVVNHVGDLLNLIS